MDDTASIVQSGVVKIQPWIPLSLGLYACRSKELWSAVDNRPAIEIHNVFGACYWTDSSCRL